MPTPEQLARRNIDDLLDKCGWIVVVFANSGVITGGIMLDAFVAVRTLLVVRNYQDKPVPEASLRRILEAGRLTGRSMNGQPWHFVVALDHTPTRSPMPAA
jgi:hypothetical protein